MSASNTSRNVQEETGAGPSVAAPQFGQQQTPFEAAERAESPTEGDYVQQLRAQLPATLDRDTVIAMLRIMGKDTSGPSQKRAKVAKLERFNGQDTSANNLAWIENAARYIGASNSTPPPPRMAGIEPNHASWMRSFRSMSAISEVSSDTKVLSSKAKHVACARS